MIDIENSLSLSSFIKDIDKYKSFALDNLNDAEKALIISLAHKKTNKDILLITGGVKQDILFDNLSYQSNNILELPSWDTLPQDDLLPSADIIGKRFSTLNTLAYETTKSHILLCPLQSALQKLLSIKKAKSYFYNFKINDTVDFDFFIEILSTLGYKRASLVSNKNEFAIRGGIIDVFPSSSDIPYRIEFFSDTIENIRTFDFVSQKSIKKVSSLFIPPACEKELLKNEELSSILDYLKKDTIIIFDDILHVEDNYVSIKKLNIHSKYFYALDDFFEKINHSTKIYFSEKPISSLSSIQTYEMEKNHQKINFEIFNQSITAQLWFHSFESYLDFLKIKEETEILDLIPYFIEKRSKIIFLLSNESEEKHLKEILFQKHIALDPIIIFEKGYLSNGFAISDLNTVVIPFSEITKRKKLRRQKIRSTYHTPAAEFHHLEPGDLVVHFHSGIGKYLGCEKHKNHLGEISEFLIIEYAESSKLYVPVNQSHLVSRYIGASEESPSLNTIGSNKWQKVKLSAQKQIIGYASDLLKMHAEREVQGGFKYPEDSDETKLFEMDFPYEETYDQINAIKEIKKDMISENAMDRLICGDVGYGKTEVAMRTAFKAAYDGKKQVAVLVPTTVLAMQHYETFKERMASYPINIDVVSRFKTTKQNKATIKKLKEGNVDIIIGTHRLLSKDISFKDLGLIIIDEEQRFGVRAKEHLKKFKKTAACLTLSATPIPRTLYMSLIKVKEISVINTPPQDRVPIKTIITENDDEIIKNAIQRELAREGQVFFIHNRVESIYKRSEHIQKLLPDAKIEIVHGQMPADTTDEIFHQFKQGKIDILFSTTIVENGIDIPNANTILIDRADTFGLADLYQLRGRVGRWNRSSFAYLITPKNRLLPEISQKRLNALLESSGYGGGMKIAMRDLEIRGAGDILGVKQSGQIQSIGFHLYCKLLKKTIESFKTKKPASFIETKIEFPQTASIPDSYINEANLRMELYFRLGEASSNQMAEEILKEMEDRFGKAPQEVLWLLALTKIKIFANQNNFTHLRFKQFTLFAEKQFGKKKTSKTLNMPKIKTPKEFEKEVFSLLQNNFY